jgi:hypothetical protein
LGYFCNKTTAQSKQSPNRPKLAQSGHPFASVFAESVGGDSPVLTDAEEEKCCILIS